MPTPDHNSDRFWYSFDVVGLVHMIMIDTEIALGPGSAQYAFLENDLKAVNRTNTPWVVVMGVSIEEHISNLCHSPTFSNNNIITSKAPTNVLW